MDEMDEPDAGENGAAAAGRQITLGESYSFAPPPPCVCFRIRTERAICPSTKPAKIRLIY